VDIFSADLAGSENKISSDKMARPTTWRNLLLLLFAPRKWEACRKTGDVNA
jgi:hypothetical protein